MKKYFTFIALFAFSYSVKAQDVQLAPEVGVLYQSMTQKINDSKYNTEYQIGAKVGAHLDISFNTRFSLQTGAFLQLNTGAESSFTKNYYLGSGLPTSDKDVRRYHINYVKVPLMAVIKTGAEFDDPHFTVGFGPYVAYAIGGNFQQEYTNTLNGEPLTKRYDEPLKIGNHIKDHIRPFDFGLQAALGYELPFGLYFKAHYGVGLLNVFPKGVPNSFFRNHGGGLSAGYYFDLTKRKVWER